MLLTKNSRLDENQREKRNSYNSEETNPIYDPIEESTDKLTYYFDGDFSSSINESQTKKMGTNVTKELLNNSISNSSGDDPDFNLSSSDPQRESNANNLTIGPSVDRNPRCMDLILDCGMKVYHSASILL